MLRPGGKLVFLYDVETDNVMNREDMGEAALRWIQHLGGWIVYGELVW